MNGGSAKLLSSFLSLTLTLVGWMFTLLFEVEEWRRRIRQMMTIRMARDNVLLVCSAGLFMDMVYHAS